MSSLSTYVTVSGVVLGYVMLCCVVLRYAWRGLNTVASGVMGIQEGLCLCMPLSPLSKLYVHKRVTKVTFKCSNW